MSDNDNIDQSTTLASGSSAAARELAAGTLVGGTYLIKSTIGRGGMGVVYRAENQVFHRDYALKALAPERVNQTDWSRFQTEGKAIARLDHPNIVKVYDMGTDGPHCLYYVMDLLQGKSLADYIEQRRLLSADLVLELFSQICSGLSYAHKQGLVHRDLKPSNIIICQNEGDPRRPLVKVIDFGLVKLLGEADQLRQSQTATGQVCGSPFYMSPEQCMGGKIDQRSDIYSLGCTLFECLTGKPPFSGKNGLETAFMHQNQAPPLLRDTNPSGNFSEELEQLVGRMLQKIPAQRYQSMDQIAQDLIRVRKGKSINREAARKGDALFEVPELVEPGPVEKTVAPIALFAVLGLVVIAAGVMAYCFLFSPIPRKNASAVLTESPLAGYSPQPDNPDARAQKEYDQWPQISNGVTVQNGQRVRVFRFPHTTVGKLVWDGKKVPAMGVITVPASAVVTLDLARPDGVNARRYPDILSKIGPDDISALLIREPEHEVDSSSTLGVITPAIVHAVRGWRILQKLDFYHASVPRQTTLALNQLHHVNYLNLHNADIDGKDLVNVKWLDQLVFIDVKNLQAVDPLLHRLSGSTAISNLIIDGCMPAPEALRGLASCPNLKVLNFSGRKLSDEQLKALCAIPNLEELYIGSSSLSVRSVSLLAGAKKLKKINLGEIEFKAYEKAKEVLPKCEAEAKPFDSRYFNPNKDF